MFGAWQDWGVGGWQAWSSLSSVWKAWDVDESKGLWSPAQWAPAKEWSSDQWSSDQWSSDQWSSDTSISTSDWRDAKWTRYEWMNLWWASICLSIFALWGGLVLNWAWSWWSERKWAQWKVSAKKEKSWSWFWSRQWSDWWNKVGRLAWAAWGGLMAWGLWNMWASGVWSNGLWSTVWTLPKAAQSWCLWWACTRAWAVWMAWWDVATQAGTKEQRSLRLWGRTLESIFTWSPLWWGSHWWGANYFPALAMVSGIADLMTARWWSYTSYQWIAKDWWQQYWQKKTGGAKKSADKEDNVPVAKESIFDRLGWWGTPAEIANKSNRWNEWVLTWQNSAQWSSEQWNTMTNWSSAEYWSEAQNSGVVWNTVRWVLDWGRWSLIGLIAAYALWAPMSWTHTAQNQSLWVKGQWSTWEDQSWTSSRWIPSQWTTGVWNKDQTQWTTDTWVSSQWVKPAGEDNLPTWQQGHWENNMTWNKNTWAWEKWAENVNTTDSESKDASWKQDTWKAGSWADGSWEVADWVKSQRWETDMSPPLWHVEDWPASTQWIADWASPERWGTGKWSGAKGVPSAENAGTKWAQNGWVQGSNWRDGAGWKNGSTWKEDSVWKTERPVSGSGWRDISDWQGERWGVGSWDSSVNGWGYSNLRDAWIASWQPNGWARKSWLAQSWAPKGQDATEMARWAWWGMAEWEGSAWASWASGWEWPAWSKQWAWSWWGVASWATWWCWYAVTLVWLWASWIVWGNMWWMPSSSLWGTMAISTWPAVWLVVGAVSMGMYFHENWWRLRPTLTPLLAYSHVMAIFGILSLYMGSYNVSMINGHMLALYMLGAFGITCGSHRLWSHTSYKCTWPVQFIFMIFTCIANQGDILSWSRDHRVHHKYSDTPADPHDSNRGFWYAHCVWLLVKRPAEVVEAEKEIDVSDLTSSAIVRWNAALSPWLQQAVCFLLPALWGYNMYGSSMWVGLLTIGYLRWVLTLHGTWTVNSVAHWWGDRPYSPHIRPCESLFTAIVSNGEGWHNWHHSYPFDYSTAEKGCLQQYNPSKALLDTLALFGQVYERKRAVNLWHSTMEKRNQEYMDAITYQLNNVAAQLEYFTLKKKMLSVNDIKSPGDGLSPEYRAKLRENINLQLNELNIQMAKLKQLENNEHRIYGKSDITHWEPNKWPTTDVYEQNTTIADMAMIPSDCLKKNAWSGMVSLLRDIALYCAVWLVSAWIWKTYISAYIQNNDTSWILNGTIGLTYWSLYAVVQGTIGLGFWIIGYEASGGRLFEWRWLNHLSGVILHAILLIPYMPRRIARHEERGRSDLQKAIRQDAWTLFRLPSRHPWQIGFFAAAIAATGYGWWIYTRGILSWLSWVGAPLLVVNIWLTLYAYLLETTPEDITEKADLGWKKNQTMDATANQQGAPGSGPTPTSTYFTLWWLTQSIDKTGDAKQSRWSKVLNALHHNLPKWHVIQGVNRDVPHYRVQEAFLSIKEWLNSIGASQLFEDETPQQTQDDIRKIKAQ